MAITKDQIFAVADELDAAGQNATLAAVRKALGGGSFTTISEGMTEWKARKAAKETPLREPAPPAVADRLAELGAEIWSSALDLANARLAAERDSLDAARLQLEADKAEAAELADQVTAELELAKAALATAAAAEQAARNESDGLRQMLADQNLRAATSEARANEIEKRANDLNAELARVNQQNTELVAGLAAAAKPATPAGAGPTRRQ
jgi:chromosome segregation ATPase